MVRKIVSGSVCIGLIWLKIKYASSSVRCNDLSEVSEMASECMNDLNDLLQEVK
jgi:hypothetical protein